LEAVPQRLKATVEKLVATNQDLKDQDAIYKIAVGKKQGLVKLCFASNSAKLS